MTYFMFLIVIFPSMRENILEHPVFVKNSAKSLNIRVGGDNQDGTANPCGVDWLDSWILQGADQVPLDNPKTLIVLRLLKKDWYNAFKC